MGLILTGISTLNSSALYAEQYMGTWTFNFGNQSVQVADVDINYAEQKIPQPNITGRAFSVEAGMYLEPTATTTNNTTPSVTSQATESVFKNAFDCILTRSMIDYGGNIPLDIYLWYHNDTNSCMNGTTPNVWITTSGTLPKNDIFITIWSYVIEKANHGRPENPNIEINPMNYSADRPQAWSQTTINADQTQTIDWYYNALWAEAEWEYLWLYLPFASDYTLLLTLDKTLLDLASWWYSTINYPLMISRDTDSAYYWTSHPTGQVGYLYGVYYDPVANKSMEINVKSDANIMLPVRFIKW